MNTETVLNILKASSNANFIKIYQKQGISETILGVMKGPIRKLADQIKTDQGLALELWDTNIYEARILAISILDPAQVSLDQLKAMVQSSQSLPVIDELTLDYFEAYADPWDAYLKLRDDKDPILQRVAYNATIILAHRKKLTPEQTRTLLDLIEKQLATIDPIPRYAMNRTLVEIAVNQPALTDTCLALGERLGVYKEMKVAKGCTSAYAPDWIRAILRRKA